VDRRRVALRALLGFAVLTAVAIVFSGSRPGTGQGIAPLVVQVVGYAFALAAALVLLAPEGRFGPQDGADRKLGGAVLLALVVLVLLDAVADTEGANIGAGFLRLICLVVIVAVAARLMSTTMAPGRRPPGK